MTEKQEWLYTEDGPELQKAHKPSKLKINKWYFITPWIIWIAVIFYCFILGGNWAAIGFLLIVFGPVPLTILNIKTLRRLMLGKLQKSNKNARIT